MIDYVEGFRELLAANGRAGVVDRVRSAFAERPELFADADTGAVCHGWVTPEHVAVRDGAVVSVIDFEHATAVPAEFDHLRTTLPTFDGCPANRAFRDGYTVVRPVSVDRDDPGYRLRRLVSSSDSLYVQNARPPEETAERTDRVRTVIDETLARID